MMVESYIALALLVLLLAGAYVWRVDAVYQDARRKQRQIDRNIQRQTL